ncbi:MAG: hypothetical protein KDJ16_17375 [Hyphomicrobiales bacterium]|nr:hypothetical protein [Hyphomicrobiales bacterium]
MIEALVASPETMGGQSKSSFEPVLPPTKPSTDTAAATLGPTEDPVAVPAEPRSVESFISPANINAAHVMSPVAPTTAGRAEQVEQNTVNTAQPAELEKVANNPFDRVGSVVDGFGPKAEKVEGRVDSAAMHDEVRRVD